MLLCLALGIAATAGPWLAVAFASGLRLGYWWRGACLGPVAAVFVFLGGIAFGHSFVMFAIATATLEAAALSWGFYHLLRPTRVVRGLLNPTTRAAVLTRLAEGVDAETGPLPYEYSRIVVAASNVLLQLGEHERLGRWLARVDHRRLTLATSEVVANNEAVAWLRARKLTEARAALAKAEAPVTVVFASTDALVLALEGEYEAAQSKLAALPKDGALRPTALEVEATVHAGRGDMDRAEASLRSLLATHGSMALESVVEKGGPAAPLAHAMRKARRGYR